MTGPRIANRIDLEIEGACLDLATAADLPALLRFAAGFNREDNHPFGERQREAISEIVDRPEWGAVRMIRKDGRDAGYAIVCYGFSVEFGGRDGFIDEIYVDPTFRGGGLGAAALKGLIQDARRAGFAALHLEVMLENERAQALYQRLGFEVRSARLCSAYL